MVQSESVVPTTQGEATRSRILDAAAQAFSESGFSGATLRDIGASAGVPFQSIRHHFGSKEDPWEAVVEELSRRSQEGALRNEEAIASLPPREQIRAQILALVTRVAGHPQLSRILLREAMKDSDRYRKAYELHVRDLAELAGKFFGRMQEAGVVKNGIPIEDFLFVFEGALLHRLVAPAASQIRTGKPVTDPSVIKRHADAVTQLLLKDG